MAVVYTTAAIVREQIHHISADLSDGDIETIINMAENAVDAIMKKSGINGTDFTFSAGKHGLIRLATTMLTCFLVLSSDTEEYVSTGHASLTADLFIGMWKECAEQLSDARVVEYLINL